MSAKQGKTILITGGCSGIGAVLFEKEAIEGNTVIIGDINDGNTLVQQLKEKTGNSNLYFLPCDVTDFSSQQRFFREACQLGNGVINNVIVNAGINNSGESTRFLEPPDYTTGELDHPKPRYKTIDVNLIGAMNTVHIALSYFSKTRSTNSAPSSDCHILLICSIAGLYGLPVVPIYSISKHGITGLFRSLRFQSSDQFRLNMICPYFTDTPILGLGGKILLAGAALSTTEDVASAASRTINDESLNGRCMVITPKATVAQAREMGLLVPDAKSEDEIRSSWECYDPNDTIYEHFAKRVLMLVNYQAKRKEWIDWIGDMIRACSWGITEWWKSKGGKRKGKLS